MGKEFGITTPAAHSLAGLVNLREWFIRFYMTTVLRLPCLVSIFHMLMQLLKYDKSVRTSQEETDCSGEQIHALNVCRTKPVQ